MAKETLKSEPNMIKEIHEQPAVIQFLLNKYLDPDKEFFKLKGLGPELKKIKRVTFLGSGSSSHAATLGNYMFEEIVGLPCEMELTDEFISREKVIEPGTAVIAISQSGETTDIVEAAKQAKQKKALVIAITNNAGSKLTTIAHYTILTEAGKELALAATKTFTTQITVLLLLVIFWLNSLGKKLPSKLLEEVRKLPSKINEIFKSEAKFRTLANCLKEKKHIIILGRKYNYPVALEGALKLKEVSYLHAEGMAAEEFRHGPKAIVESGYSIIVLSPMDSVFAESKRLIKQLKNEDGQVIAVTNKELKEIIDLADDLIYIPITLEILNPILLVIPLQLLAFYLAQAKGIDIDNPRNLKKFIVNPAP